MGLPSGFTPVPNKKPLKGYRPRMPSKLPPEVGVEERRLMRSAQLEWGAYEKARTARSLGEWIRAWAKNRYVSCIFLGGKFGAFSATTPEDIDACYDLYKAMHDACPLPMDPKLLGKTPMPIDALSAARQTIEGTKEEKAAKDAGAAMATQEKTVVSSSGEAAPKKEDKIDDKTVTVSAMTETILTGGGLGLLGRFVVVTNDVTFLSPMDPEQREDLPRFVDGGVGYRLSRTGPYGRCAALSGIDIKGPDLALAGLATHVVTHHTIDTLLEELEACVASEPPDLLELLHQSLDNSSSLCSLLLENEIFDDDRGVFQAFAEKYFTPKNFDDVLGLLSAGANDGDEIAELALHNIRTNETDARILARLLNDCEPLDFHSALALERTVAHNILQATSGLKEGETKTTDLSAYFLDTTIADVEEPPAVAPPAPPAAEQQPQETTV